MAEELLPCPFCGGPAKSITCMGDWTPDGYGPQRHRVVCAALYETPSRKCAASLPSDTNDEAIAAWNRRPSPPLTGDREKIAGIIDTLVDGVTYHNANCWGDLKDAAIDAILALPVTGEGQEPVAWDSSPAPPEAKRHGFPTMGDLETFRSWFKKKAAMEGDSEVGAGFCLSDPVAWRYQLVLDGTGVVFDDWRVSLRDPTGEMRDGYPVRNIQPLFAHPAPAQDGWLERQEQGVAALRIARQTLAAGDVATADAMIQVALDFFTNDEAALAEGARFAPLPEQEAV